MALAIQSDKVMFEIYREPEAAGRMILELRAGEVVKDRQRTW